MIRLIGISFIFLFSSIGFAEGEKVFSFFKDAKPTFITAKGTLKARHARIVALDFDQLSASLARVFQQGFQASQVEIELPLADGAARRYHLVENNTLHPDLRAKFPTIKTYDAYGISDPSEFVKLDLTSQGFHAMILKPGQSPVFIDPLEKGNTQYYMVYNKKDFIASQPLKCGVHGQSNIQTLTSAKHFANFNQCQHKQYRLAMAATAQYTQFQGGTVNDALSAQATTINRVNGVYETDMAITFQIIADNNLIIYTDPNNQPYTHGVPELLIDENQENITQVIGSANYDIGHVVDSSGSGLARLESVCSDAIKAMGVTGRDEPVGDPFDIDYVAHEIGHQFGAHHVQNNNCNRFDPTAVEPGSGSTIMGYAGICAPNVQMASDAYFNGISLEEMGNFVSSPYHTCPVIQPIASAPTIKATNGGGVIPILTPFSLSAIAAPTQSNQVLTYTWEQMDNGISKQPPLNSSAKGPNFRSFSPQLNGTRFFPNLRALSDGGPFTWEVLPSVSRKMSFRVSVRANTPGGSCNAYYDTTLRTTDSAGPFIVTSPTQQGINWLGMSSQRVTWDVANTQFYPVKAYLVNIFLSLDGGHSFPYPMFLNAANDGGAEVCLPNVNSDSARIMVQSSDGTFFNISKYNFSITAVAPKAPLLTKANRNRMNAKEAFVLYAGCIFYLDNHSYTVNGLPGAVVRLDKKNQRFIISNILTPKRTHNVTITARDENNISRTSNPITIPSIL